MRSFLFGRRKRIRKKKSQKTTPHRQDTILFCEKIYIITIMIIINDFLIEIRRLTVQCGHGSSFPSHIMYIPFRSVIGIFLINYHVARFFFFTFFLYSAQVVDYYIDTYLEWFFFSLYSELYTIYCVCVCIIYVPLRGPFFIL